MKDEQKKQRQSSKKEKDKYFKDNWQKIVAAFIIFWGLFVFLDANLYLTNILNWKSLIASCFAQVMCIVLVYDITLCINIKSEKLRFAISFIFAILVDNLFDFQFSFEFSLKNILLLLVMVVFTIFEFLNIIFYNKIRNKVVQNKDNIKVIVAVVLYCVFIFVVVCLHWWLFCHLYYYNHTIHWTSK